MQANGLYRFEMKVNGAEQTAIVEILPPGLPSYDLVRIARGEWRNIFVPHISQNRIECLCSESIEHAPAGWRPIKSTSLWPVRVWQAIAPPNE